MNTPTKIYRRGIHLIPADMRLCNRCRLSIEELNIKVNTTEQILAVTRSNGMRTILQRNLEEYTAALVKLN